MKGSGIRSYAEVAFPHLQKVLDQNLKTIEKIGREIVSDVQAGKSLFVFGSGHSALLPLEVYHRAGGPYFVIPLVMDYLLPHAGPPLVRLMERQTESARILLNRAEPKSGEMIWIASQSGINSLVIEVALEAKARGLRSVAFTSLNHSKGVSPRHPSKKKLFEICDEVIDLGGVTGDAAVPITPQISTGPLSTLTSILLAHSILTFAQSHLEESGYQCTYSSVNTSEGGARNLDLEKKAGIRDPLLR
jgi:uncharacterized phosphosugar-binding protein